MGLMDRLKVLFNSRPNASGTIRLGTGGSYQMNAWGFSRVANSVYANPTGYRCVEIIMENFCRPSWEVRKEGSDGERFESHRLLDALNSPNATTSGTMMQRTMARDLELTGKSVWVKMQGNDDLAITGPIVGFKRLPPQRVTVIGNEDDELLGFMYKNRKGQKTPALPEDILYFRYPHPEREYDGLPPAVIAGLPSETDTAAATFNFDLLANDGALPGYVTVEGLTTDEFREWEALWRSGEVPGRTRFMGGMAKYFKVGQSNQELMYDKLRDMSQDDICKGFGVAKVLLDPTDTTFTNMGEARQLLWQQTVLGKIVLASDEATLQVGKDEGVIVGMDLDDIEELQEAQNDIVERAGKLLDRDAITINEYRADQGLDPVPWGDYPLSYLRAIYSPFAAGAYANVGAMPEVEQEETPATQAGAGGGAVEPDIEQIGKAYLRAIGSKQKRAELDKVKQSIETGAAAKRAERALKRFFDRQITVVTKRLEAVSSKKTTGVKWFGRERWVDELSAELEYLFDIGADLAKHYAEQVIEQQAKDMPTLGTPKLMLDLVPKHLSEYAAKAAGVLADRLSKGVRREWPGWKFDRALTKHYAEKIAKAHAEVFSKAPSVAEDAARKFTPTKAADDLKSAILAYVKGHLDDIDVSDLVTVISELYGDSYLAGTFSAAKSVDQAGGSGSVISSFEDLVADIDWDKWKPGNGAAANELADGGLKNLLDEAGVTIKGVKDTTIDRIGSRIAEGVEAGDSVTTIGKSIEEFIADETRAETIAQTETARAMSVATLKTYDENGVQQKEWLTAEDDLVDEDCMQNEDDGSIDLSAHFSSGHGEPPAHPNCRCAVMPVIDTSEDGQ